MPYTDSHGRPELLMHPDIKRGRAGYRLETPPKKATRKRTSTTQPASGPDDTSTENPTK
jgi:hypothetical protein